MLAFNAKIFGVLRLEKFVTTWRENVRAKYTHGVQNTLFPDEIRMKISEMLITCDSFTENKIGTLVISVKQVLPARRIAIDV